ncbi:hypothetical protein [Tenacibaculum retecalamus]|uniref:hypothetical protein n=1 Tax=Tenacibaculum retecalamus TaxID=3018315 RepID=UPI0023D93B3B|nr:hypothetical protein [Tenacibaculum retecalamus]WBX70369.1 hypothetical protein PG912_08770 [Tenacibaculum retecalamus]
MKGQLKYKPNSLKSREENSSLISGSSYAAKVGLTKKYNSKTILKSVDLGNGYHSFVDSIK